MHGLRLILVGLTMGSVQPAFSQTFEGGSRLEVIRQNAYTSVVKTETRFVEDYYQNMFKFTSRTVRRADADGEEQSGLIEAYTTAKSLYDTKTWTLKVKGAELKILNDEFVQVNEYGCCASPTINRLINRKTGVLVEAAWNDTTLEFSVPNSKLSSRYLAQVSDSKAPATRGRKKYIGTISYFDGQRIKSRARIYADLPDGWGTDFYDLKPVAHPKDDVQNKVITLFSADASNDPIQAFSGIGISGRVDYDSKSETFSVIVNGDQIDPKLTKSSSGIEIEVL